MASESDGFTIKDSGVREQYEGGMVRDTADRGVSWSNIHYGPMLYRWAVHTTKGRQKYEDPEPGIPNWTLGRGLEVWLRAQESFERHSALWLAGHRDEDHAAAIYFNVNLKEYIEMLLTPAERLAAFRIQQLRNDQPYTAGEDRIYDGEEDEAHALPCTCTIACIPAGITDEQTCKESLPPGHENCCGPSYRPAQFTPDGPLEAPGRKLLTRQADEAIRAAVNAGTGLDANGDDRTRETGDWA